jgi:putative phosphoesterase
VNLRQRFLMIIGLLADSHGRQRTTAAAVAMLLDRGVEMLIHLGDFETVEVVDELVGHNACGVLGNCDYPHERFLRYAEHVGVKLQPESIELVLGETRLLATHGHVERVMSQAISDEVNYLLHGHSHALRDEMVGTTRIINPGALARASRYTAAVLDTNRGELNVVEVPRELD